MNSLRISYKLFALLTLLAVVGIALPIYTAQGATSTQTVYAAADAPVRSDAPGTNYGSDHFLNIDASPAIRSYVKFNVAGLNGAAVTSAKLRFYVYDDSASGFSVSRVSDSSWTESGINYNNAPAIGTKIGGVGGYTYNVWLEFDVTSIVTGDGAYSFALNTTADTTTAMASRENGAQGPQLVITTSSSSPTAVPTTAPTIAPTTAPTTAPVIPPAPTTAPAIPASGSLTFQAAADAPVRSDAVGTNYGGDKYLNIDANPVIRSYVKFNVSGLNGATVTSAKLRFYVYDDSSSSVSVAKVSSNNWTESGITYNNAPALGSTLASTNGGYTYSVWLDFDVTSAITSDGTYSFALITGNDTTTAMASRENGAQGPQLVLTLGSAPAPTAAPTIAPTKAPTAGPTIAPTNPPAVPTATKAPTTAPTTAPTVPPPAPTIAPSPSSMYYYAVADAPVRNDAASTNYGGDKYLNIDGNPVIRSYVKFNVSGLNGAKVTSAKLRFYVYDDSSSAVSVSRVNDSSWTESGITYNNAPALGSTLASTNGGFGYSVWLDFDVTSAITGDGIYSFALNTPNDTTTAMASRENGSDGPQLIVTVNGSSTQPTTAPTAGPTTAPTKAPTSAPTTSPTKAPTAAPTATKAPTAVPTQSGNPLPYGVSGTWNLKFSDDFNGTSLSTSKWEPNWLAGNATTITKPVNGNEQSCYDPAQVSVSGGNMKMTAVQRSCRASNGTTYSYASGLVNTHSSYTFTYGYMEARVWLDGSSSVKNWPAFWADGTGTWPTTGEIDVMEGLGGSPAWHFHYGSTSSPQQVGGTPSMSTKTGWHIFAADWEPGSIKFYYDGKLVGTVTSGVTSSPMYLILNLGVSSSISGPIQVPSDFLVDYVRVWQH